MDGLDFDLSSLLSPEEAEELENGTAVNENQDDGGQDAGSENDNNDNGSSADADDHNDNGGSGQEGVGDEDDDNTDKEKKDANNRGDGSSPSVYSSIAHALKEDGIFSDLDDKDFESIEDSEAFGELFEKALQSRFDARMKRIDEALNNGIKPDVISQYESIIKYLDSIDESALESEDEDGENLRKNLIYNDLISRGYSKERAERELKKSFDSNSDIDDAKDALESLRTTHKNNYNKILDDAKRQRESAVAKQRKTAEEFKKLVFDNDTVLGDITLDKNTKQKIYDAVSKPVYKDPDTGVLMTAVQKFQKEHPNEFLRQLGTWFVLTNEGKDTNGFTKGKVRKEKNKALKELADKLAANNVGPDGNFRFLSGGNESGTDVLLSDDWKIG